MNSWLLRLLRDVQQSWPQRIRRPGQERAQRGLYMSCQYLPFAPKTYIESVNLLVLGPPYASRLSNVLFRPLYWLGLSDEVSNSRFWL
jgi:hypothetical protein